MSSRVDHSVPMTDTPETMAQRDAARRLGVEPKTIRNWIASGRLDAISGRPTVDSVEAEEAERSGGDAVDALPEDISTALGREALRSIVSANKEQAKQLSALLELLPKSLEVIRESQKTLLDSANDSITRLTESLAHAQASHISAISELGSLLEMRDQRRSELLLAEQRARTLSVVGEQAAGGLRELIGRVGDSLDLKKRLKSALSTEQMLAVQELSGHLDGDAGPQMKALLGELIKEKLAEEGVNEEGTKDE